MRAKSQRLSATADGGRELSDGETNMIVVMNRITVAEGREEEFEQTFVTRDRAVDQMTGFIDLEVLRPSEGRTYIVMTRWNSREAFDTWTSSE
ncbi:MAG TPA: antibiotic biosynthesis monooxygenase, partial [Pyrinomonadaceae bacterium]|nr:antibiotic biosynthesis monooxygenase [Pyrinomonadaceae bacterium]